MPCRWPWLSRSKAMRFVYCVEASGAPLVFRAYQQGDMFRLGPLRIPEPLPSAPLAVPDVVLAPLVRV